MPYASMHLAYAIQYQITSTIFHSFALKTTKNYYDSEIAPLTKDHHKMSLNIMQNKKQVSTETKNV